MKKKLLVSTITLILAVCLIYSNVFALEIYYDTTQTPYGPAPIVLKWNYKSGSKLYLTCSNDKLTGPLASYYSSGLSKWTTACPTTISIVDGSFSSSRIDFVTTTQSWWSTNIGEPSYQVLFGGITVAITYNYDTNGRLLDSLADAKASTKRIGSANIFVNPYPDAYDNTYSNIGVVAPTTAQKPAILAHELGHVMGMGHSNVGYYATTAASIMKQYVSQISLTPQTYDKSEVSAHIP